MKDAAGDMYLAGAQLFVYSATGKPLGVVEIPERRVPWLSEEWIIALCISAHVHVNTRFGRGLCYSVDTLPIGCYTFVPINYER